MGFICLFIYLENDFGVGLVITGMARLLLLFLLSPASTSFHVPAGGGFLATRKSGPSAHHPPLTRRGMGFDPFDDDDDDDLLPDISSRGGISRFKEQSDFLAIAREMNIVKDEDMAAEREKARAAEEAQRALGPKGSKFDEWMGGLMAGTGQGIDKDDRMARGEEEDEDDILVRLARRVEERRAELEAGGSGSAAAELAAAKADSVGEDWTAPAAAADSGSDDAQPAAPASPPKKRRRKRKDASA